MRRALAIAFGVAISLVPAIALAEGRADVDRDLRAYYDAEKSEGYVFIALGAASMAAGGYLLTRKNDLARGAAIPMLALGAVQAFGVGIYAFGLDAKVRELEADLARDPAAFREKELAHVEGVKSRFVAYRWTELAFFVAGLGAMGVGTWKSSDRWRGTGIALAFESLTLLSLDYYAERRAHRYADQLRAFEPTVAMSVGAFGAPWSIDVGARF